MGPLPLPLFQGIKNPGGSLELIPRGPICYRAWGFAPYSSGMTMLLTAEDAG